MRGCHSRGNHPRRTPAERAAHIAELTAYIRSVTGDSHDEAVIDDALDLAGHHRDSTTRHDVRKAILNAQRDGSSGSMLDYQRFVVQAARPTLMHGTVGYSCRYCGAPSEHIDHVWPRALGGDDHPNNLVPACQRCNNRKAAKSIFPSACPSCGQRRHPGDMDTATGTAFYSCRCGHSWSYRWTLQAAQLVA